MRDMEYLTEKDLPYFEKKAKTGEVVIIYIDPEALLQADTAVDELLAIEEEKQKTKTNVSDEELMAFLEKHRLLLDEEAKKNLIVIRENEELQKLLDEQEKKLAKMRERKKPSVEEIIESADRNQDMLSLIRRAIQEGFTDDEIRIVSARDLDDKKRSELYEAIRLRR